MKKSLQITTLISLIFIMGSGPLMAQDIVTLTVTGQGATQEEARDNALRSAIEQAFGVFISSNTEIVNDELTRDEIVTVSSGNIQDFEIVYENKLSEDNYINTIKAIVAIQNLTTYAESKGVDVEVKGGLFAANMRQQELNEKNEKASIENMMVILKDLLSKSFDQTLNVGNPQKSGEEWDLPLEVIVKDNENYNEAWKYLNSTISGLSISLEEWKSYVEARKLTYPFIIDDNNYRLRNYNSVSLIMNEIPLLLASSIFNFKIYSNDRIIEIDMPVFKKEEGSNQELSSEERFFSGGYNEQEQNFNVSTNIKGDITEYGLEFDSKYLPFYYRIRGSGITDIYSAFKFRIPEDGAKVALFTRKQLEFYNKAFNNYNSDSSFESFLYINDMQKKDFDQLSESKRKKLQYSYDLGFVTPGMSKMLGNVPYESNNPYNATRTTNVRELTEYFYPELYKYTAVKNSKNFNSSEKDRFQVIGKIKFKIELDLSTLNEINELRLEN